jgi:hypothetical protein
VLAALATAGCGGSDGSSGGGDNKEVASVTCTLSVKALNLVVGKIKGGGDLAEILGLLSLPLQSACKSTLSTYLNNPSQLATFQLATRNGPVSKTVTFDDLVAPRPTPTSSPGFSRERFARILDCADAYDYGFFYNACVNGDIDPISP